MPVWSDIRVGVRLLIRDRALTLAAVVALALGIAATTTVYTIVNAVVLRDVPFAEPDRLIRVGHRIAGPQGRQTVTLSHLDFKDLSDAARTVSLFGYRQTTMNFADAEDVTARYLGAFISSNALALLGHRPAIGRDFRPEDDRRGAEPVAIIGHAIWRDRYQSDPNAIGRTFRVNGMTATVIGVMPEGFSFPEFAQLWMPLGLEPPVITDRRDTRHVLFGVGRLAPDVTIEQARSELETIGTELARLHPDTNKDVHVWVREYQVRSFTNGRPCSRG